MESRNESMLFEVFISTSYGTTVLQRDIRHLFVKFEL
jgi:hypothetical protein